MSLFNFRNGKKSLIRVRAIGGFIRVLFNRKHGDTEVGQTIHNKMSVKYTIRGDKE